MRIYKQNIQLIRFSLYYFINLQNYNIIFQYQKKKYMKKSIKNIIIFFNEQINSRAEIQAIICQLLDKLGEGTYGTVYAAKDKKTNQTVAIKKVKIHDQNEGFPITCLREIKILQKLAAHPNIVNLLVK
ncbi:hypothetical protein pb186bvf_011813 [Paramecium bursaria]